MQTAEPKEDDVELLVNYFAVVVHIGNFVQLFWYFPVHGTWKAFGHGRGM